MPRKTTARKPTVAIVGAGRLATLLAVALHEAGFTLTEIVARDSPRSERHARALAAKVGAQAVTARSAALDATLLWLCVPDGEIRGAASALAAHLAAGAIANHKGSVQERARFAFHSSGAQLSRELEPLRKAGAAIASVHPLMTFVAGAHPSLTGVPFALEGDDAATRVARRIVGELGGESFSLPERRKAAYHAWATLTSPLLLAFLVTLEEAARVAGLTRRDARRKNLPIIRQTLANYSRLGPARSFSGPLVRGDAETVAKHLAALKQHPQTREVYVALARAALHGLPVKNRDELRRLLRATEKAAAGCD
ncbi:MAG: Rossmann-like and DUF2520 domain-containing protein [Terriglobales bacterium]